MVKRIQSITYICENCKSEFHPADRSARFCCRKCYNEGVKSKTGYTEPTKTDMGVIAQLNAIARNSRHKTYGRYVASLHSHFRPENPKEKFGF